MFNGIVIHFDELYDDQYGLVTGGFQLVKWGTPKMDGFS